MANTLIRNILLLISILALIFVGLFWEFKRLFSLGTYKFTVNGDLSTINSQIISNLIKTNLTNWLVYLAIILICAFLAFYKKGRIRIFLILTIVLLGLFLPLETHSVFSEANILKSKLQLVSYPNVQEYKFDSFTGFISSNYKRINFTVKGSINDVFNYYKNNLPQGSKLENPEENVSVDLISDGKNTTESNFATAQLRIDLISTPDRSPDYAISFTSEKGSTSTQISVQ